MNTITRAAAARLAWLAAPVLVVILIAAAGAGVAATVFSGGSGPQPSSTAAADIPADYLALYQQAATTECPDLPWTVLAGIGKVESDHGRSTLPGVAAGSSAAGAMGPMQFLGATFATYNHPVPAGGVDPPSPYDPVDAIYAAARRLCVDGATRDLNTAVLAYNHSADYVRHVLDWSTRYGAITAATGAQKAIDFARTKIGTPYEWGGNGPPADWGYDCSGLVKAAYAAAGVTLPRTAQQQYDTGPHLPPDQPLQPGDLLFYGTPRHIHHVGLYIGEGLMIDAPDFGLTVTTEHYRWNGDDYTGATRPAN